MSDLDMRLGACNAMSSPRQAFQNGLMCSNMLIWPRQLKCCQKYKNFLLPHFFRSQLTNKTLTRSLQRWQRGLRYSGDTWSDWNHSHWSQDNGYGRLRIWSTSSQVQSLAQLLVDGRTSRAITAIRNLLNHRAQEYNMSKMKESASAIEYLH